MFGRVTKILLSAMAFLWSARAAAETVLIVRPGASPRDLTETVTRLHGELLSVGLDVKIAERSALTPAYGKKSPVAMEQIASEWQVDGIIDVVDDVVPAVDVWVFEHERRRSEVTHIVPEPDDENGTARLAIRAIDVLRSTLIARRLGPARREAPAPITAAPPSVRGERDEPASPSSRVGVELGAAVLASLDGVDPAIMPVLRIEWAARLPLALQGEMAGLGSRPTVSTAAGSARIAQQYLVLGVCSRPPAGTGVRPTLGVAAGALRTAAEGRALAPGEGHAVERWSFLVQASAGARLGWAGRYFLTLAGHAQMAEPYVAIYVADTVAATTGRPNLLLTLTAGAWL